MLISVRNLKKTYDMGTVQVHALRSASFDIEKGSFVSIMGPSGSGKTTLMDILGCLAQQTSGAYILNGEDVGSVSDNKLADLRNAEIGFVFQTFNLLPRMTALANAELPLVYANVPRNERRARAAAVLESVGLADRMNHRPTELSGGQRQRVAIARALVNNPSIILADEPTGNLDSESGMEIMDIFEELHGEGNTMVVVTHERHVADHAERILHLRDGMLVEDEVRDRVALTK
jgi:putative ABC transport system ATP-binding protein